MLSKFSKMNISQLFKRSPLISAQELHSIKDDPSLRVFASSLKMPPSP